MSDKPTAAQTPAPETAVDPSLFPRRVLVWVLSVLIGGSLVALGITFILRTSIFETVPISFLEVPLLPLAAFPMTLFIMIWLDVVFKSKIVND